MQGPLEEDYFDWLCAKVLYPSNRRQYRDFLWLLHTTEFKWVIDADANREEDGRELRQYFLASSRWPWDSTWFEEPASVLEVFIAFADRASFQTDTPAKRWFWDILTNLELGEYRQMSESDIPVVKRVLEAFMNRDYDDGGRGGMFPMRWPKRDQREVEIWYQFCEYVDENGLI